MPVTMPQSTSLGNTAMCFAEPAACNTLKQKSTDNRYREACTNVGKAVHPHDEDVDRSTGSQTRAASHRARQFQTESPPARWTVV